MLRSDPSATAARVAALSAYMNANVLSAGGEFCCASGAECRMSVQRNQARPRDFYEGQLSHVGQHYDLLDGDRALRVLIAGQEYGHGPEHVGLAARRQMIAIDSGRNHNFSASDGLPGRNPHMRGSTSALRVLFGGEPGADRAGELVELEGGDQAHIFDMFALVNLLLCSATVPGSTIGWSSVVMRRNCLRHFEATLRVLEPTVVVLQGLNVSRWISTVFESVREIDKHLAVARFDDREIALCRFSHPTARGALRWSNLDTPYLRDVVVPTLRRGRALTTPGE